MFRFAKCAVVFVGLIGCGAASVGVAQTPSNSLAANLRPASEWDVLAAESRQSDAVFALSSSYFNEETDLERAARERLVERRSADTVRENWLVVAMLGLSFCVGLTITLSMIRRAMLHPAPKRMFGH